MGAGNFCIFEETEVKLLSYFMGFFKKLFTPKKPYNPEVKFIVTVTDSLVQVEYPESEPSLIYWEDIQEIKLVNTNSGPWLPDIWLFLIGASGKCVIPHGAKGFDDAFDRISKYEEFNFENFGKSMTCTDNVEFHLWSRNKQQGRHKHG